MQPSGSVTKIIGLVLFSVGIILALLLTGLMVWADVEAVSYGFPRLGNEPMSGLACPQLMNPTEEAAFSITLRNTTEQALRPRVEVFRSEPTLARWNENTVAYAVEPGGRETNSWSVGPENVVLGSFVLIKAYTFASYPQRNVENTCGIYVIDVFGLGGSTLYWLWLAVSLGLLAVGIWLADFRTAEAEQSQGKGMARKALAFLAILGLIVGSAGWWPVGVIILIVNLIALPAVLLYGQSR